MLKTDQTNTTPGLLITDRDGKAYTDSQKDLRAIWEANHIVKGDDETPDWLPEEYEADRLAVVFSDGSAELWAWEESEGTPLEPMSLAGFQLSFPNMISVEKVRKVLMDEMESIPDILHDLSTPFKESDGTPEEYLRKYPFGSIASALSIPLSEQEEGK